MILKTGYNFNLWRGGLRHLVEITLLRPRGPAARHVRSHYAQPRRKPDIEQKRDRPGNKGKPLPLDNSSGGGRHRGSGHSPLSLPLPPEIVVHPREIAGDPELPGFVLDLTEIWEPNW
ncbi:MAG: hypothetical protein GY856_19585 [bacterium]|nr:hypothetical protein [bacterium]